MLFPDDEPARLRLLDGILARGWGDALKNEPLRSRIVVSGAAAAWLADAPRLVREDIDRIRVARERGRMVGFMLYFILSCSVFNEHKQVASVAAACRVARAAAPRPAGFDVKTIKRHIWDRYEPAAHLWAARVAWRRMNRIELDDELPGEDDLLAFLGLAEEFRRLGESWSHKQGARILDAARMWTAPADLPFPALTYRFGHIAPDLIRAANAR